jgi:uncharacterized protein (TIGR00369 family)
MAPGKAGDRVFFETLEHLYAHDLPFNRLLGIFDVSVGATGGQMRFGMHDDLIGNVFHQTLHGGVISAVLDAVGGLTASAGLAPRATGLAESACRAMLARVGTIDLRVDYLRPGRGQDFIARGRIMRAGRKVAVVRMEMVNDTDLLVAVGTGTYMIG